MHKQFPSIDIVKISNIQLINIPSRNDTYLVEISHNGETKRSQKKKIDGNSIMWHESLSLSLTGDPADQSLWDFKVVKTRLFMKVTVASHREKLVDLLQSQKDHGSCKLTVFKDCQLIFTIERRGDALPDLMNDTKNALAGTSTSERPAEIANLVMETGDFIESQEDPWMSFLSNFETFMSIVDTIAEIHPYVQLAWSILSVIPKTIISQNKRDNSINNLSQHLKEVYEYITDAKRLPTLTEMQRKALSVLVQQTIECAYFLQEYAGSNEASKILKGVNIDKKVNDFNEKFDHILNVMTNATVLEINIVTLRISTDIDALREGVEESKDLNLLEGMPHAPNAGFLSTKACLPSTRQGLITEILEWVNSSDDGSQRVFLLLGQAGTGKSAVAHTVSKIFDMQNRLGSLFCFNQSDKETRNLLFSTISRGLADTDVQWWESLVGIIKKTSIRTSLDISTQFDELIVKPSKVVRTIGPVVIVIDGLDESGDRAERAILLDFLFKRCSELPSNYRFVITSRPEPDIERQCEHPTVFCKLMADINLAETTNDIQKYVSFRLSPVEDIVNEELGDGWKFILARRAEGVFQWAKLACDIINPTVEFGVAEKVKTFTSGPTNSLYQMYHQIFRDQPEFKREGYLPAFKKIMSALVITRKPLPIQALQSLFQNEFPYKITTMMAPFHSLFLGTHDLHTPIRPLHTSLMDFLTTRSIEVEDSAKETKTISNQFYVDTSDQSSFTLACLKLMNSGESGLRFNICNLETSHIPNRDVPDLDDRLQKGIPSHLLYATYFWAIHLQQSHVNEDLLIQLRLLMCTNLLYLFETLSLAEKSVEQVCISMRILAFWCKDVDDKLASQAQDACQFGTDFGDMMVESTPHLYLSALPFSPIDSFIRNQYLDLFPHHFHIELGQSLGSPGSSNIVKRHPKKSPATALAFSRQGEYIATGFENGDFWLWDYKTGAMICQYIADEGKPEPKIDTIVFSTNGESVTFFSLNGTFKIFNINNHELVSHSYGEYPPLIGFKATISSDGRYFVFQSYIIGGSLLYNITSRSTIRLDFPSKAECIFSPNGELLAGSADVFNWPKWSHGAISIWSIQKQASIGSFCSQKKIKTMAFSPDGNHLALFSEIWTPGGPGRDGVMIQILSVPTSAKVHEFIFNVTDLSYAHRMIFSTNGQNLFLITDDEIYIMDVATWELVPSLPWQKFPHHATCVAISADGKHVAWVDKDDSFVTDRGAIQVRECQSTTRRPDPIYDTLRFTKAIFSPLNTYLVRQGYGLGDSKHLQILNTTTMIITAQVQITDLIIAISPNDEYIAYPATHGFCLWSEKRGELVLDSSDRKFTALAFSSTGDRLISGDESGTLMVWNTQTRQLVFSPYTVVLSEIGDRIIALALSGTGTQFVVAYTSNYQKNIIEIHSSQSGKSLGGPFIIGDEYHGKCTLAFSANETHIVYITYRLEFIIDAGTGQTLKTFEFERRLDVDDFPLGLSPNRKYIVLTEDEKVEVRDINTGEAIDGKWRDCHAKWTVTSNSSEEFATMDMTGEVNFWDIRSGNKSARPTFYYYRHYERSHEWNICRIMSMNDKYLVSAHHDVKIWSLETHQNVSQHHSRELRTSSVNRSEVELSGGVIHDQSLLGPDDQERTQYALVAWKNALFSEGSKITENGWVLGPDGELLFWVPKERRGGLWRPKMVYFMGPPITKLSFDNFVHGSRWIECKEKL